MTFSTLSLARRLIAARFRPILLGGLAAGAAAAAIAVGQPPPAASTTRAAESAPSPSTGGAQSDTVRKTEMSFIDAYTGGRVDVYASVLNKGETGAGLGPDRYYLGPLMAVQPLPGGRMFDRHEDGDTVRYTFRVLHTHPALKSQAAADCKLDPATISLLRVQMLRYAIDGFPEAVILPVGDVGSSVGLGRESYVEARVPVSADARFRKAAESPTGVSLRGRLYFNGIDLKRKAVTITAEDVQKTDAFKNLKQGGGHYVTAEQVQAIYREVSKTQNLVAFDEGVEGEVDRESMTLFRDLTEKLGVRPTARSQDDAEDLNRKVLEGTGLDPTKYQPVVLRFQYHQEIKNATDYKEANQTTRAFYEKNAEKLKVTVGVRYGPFGADVSYEKAKERVDQGVFADQKAFQDYKAENLTKDGEGVEIIPRGLALVEKSTFRANVSLTSRTLVLRPTALMKTIETVAPTGLAVTVPAEVSNPVDLAAEVASLKAAVAAKGDEVTARLAALTAKQPFGGDIRIHWQTPAGNPEFRELINPKEAGTGPNGERQLVRWVPFPDGRTFPTPPRVVVGLRSIDVFGGQTRLNADVIRVTGEGFEARIRTRHETGLYEADLMYVVFPQ